MIPDPFCAPDPTGSDYGIEIAFMVDYAAKPGDNPLLKHAMCFQQVQLLLVK